MPDPTPSEERLELSAPATPEMLDLVHEVLQRLWVARPDVGEPDRVRFEMAVIEVLGNIVEHAYELERPGGERRFDVSLCAGGDDLVATFGDNGVPAALDLSDVTMPGEDAESGRGLALTAAVVDDLAYERVGDRNHWRLVCHRHDG
ncbi:MAG: ATP-binding protein [Nocardioides sp.]